MSGASRKLESESNMAATSATVDRNTVLGTLSGQASHGTGQCPVDTNRRSDLGCCSLPVLQKMAPFHWLNDTKLRLVRLCRKPALAARGARSVSDNNIGLLTGILQCAMCCDVLYPRYSFRRQQSDCEFPLDPWATPCKHDAALGISVRYG